MRHPAQGATGGLVMLGLVFKWFCLYEFSLFDTPWGQFSGSLGSWSQCSHFKDSRLDLKFFWISMYSFPLVRYSCLLSAGVLHALLCLKVYS